MEFHIHSSSHVSDSAAAHCNPEMPGAAAAHMLTVSDLAKVALSRELAPLESVIRRSGQAFEFMYADNPDTIDAIAPRIWRRSSETSPTFAPGEQAAVSDGLSAQVVNMHLAPITKIA
jgi:hypothetical protein